MTYWAPLPEHLAPEYQRLVTELRALKDAQCLTYQQIGRLTHYSRASWERWLNGKRPVPRAALLSLVEATEADGAYWQVLFDVAFGRGLICDAPQPEAVPGVTASATPHSALVPRQPPAAPSYFAGRDDELKALFELVSRQPRGGDAVAISAICGPAGVGKTALAVHFAHQAAARFPDGTLYVNLRGFDSSHAPIAPADVMRRFLTALGVPPDCVPADLEDQTALYRSQLVDRRILILLDNARNADQVRPLLPGATASLVVVTSRDQLGGLVALDGAVPLTLDVLTEAEARDLLVSRLGAEWIGCDDAATGELAELCARLPLALNLVAARAALHSTLVLADLVAELRDTRRRLEALTIGDESADVRAVFSWSYRILTPEAARAFRLLGLHDGPDISIQAASCLVGLPVEAARRLLTELTRAHLLTEHAPGRFGFHDLLRVYAADRAATDCDEAERQEALRRLGDFYLHTTHAADRLLQPQRPLVELDPPAPGSAPYRLADEPAALAWLDVEAPNIMAAQRTAAERGWHWDVWRLAWSLTSYHRERGRLDDQLVAWQRAATAADRLDSPESRTRARLHLGRSCAESSRFEEANRNLELALDLARAQQDPAAEAHTRFAFVRVSELQGDLHAAFHHASRALELCRTLDGPIWEADALNATAWTAACLGYYDSARTHCEEALALIDSLDRDADDNPVRSRPDYLDTMGYIEHGSGRHDLAIHWYSQALDLFRAKGYDYDYATTLDKIGDARAALGRHDQALADWSQARELYRRQGRMREADRAAAKAAAGRDDPARPALG